MTSDNGSPQRALVAMSAAFAGCFAILALVRSLAGHPVPAALTAVASVQFLAFAVYFQRPVRGTRRTALLVVLLGPGVAAAAYLAARLALPLFA